MPEKKINQVFVKSPFIFEMRRKDAVVNTNDVLVKIKTCGICGTDVHLAKNGSPDFLPLGHEISGIVEEVGKNVDRFKPGDQVVAENHTMCGVCSSCKNGQPVYCKNIKLYYGIEAGLADYIVLHHTMFNPFNSLSFEEATMAEPLTVALDLTKTVEIPLNSDVAVFGGGTIGLLIVQLVKLFGAKSVILVDSSSGDEQSRFRMDTGKKLGADYTIGYNDPDFYNFINSKYPEGLDRIIITSPPQTLTGAIKIAKFGAFIGLIGIVFDERRTVSFDMNEFHFKRLQLRCIHELPNLLFPLALDLIKNKKILTGDIITHRFKFEDYKKAFELLEDRNQKVIKVLINI
jgi:L-iditol 2-dehydrogenase